ncbi:MAG: hypothetical protein Q4G52_10570, partial [Clostridia bacterium]|nr:hypothetical protein [Clostridia bacterium]
MEERTGETGQETVTSEELMAEATAADVRGADGRDDQNMTEPDDGGEEAERATAGGEAREQERREALTRGLAALMEDGWTQEELEAFSRDEGAARDIAQGKSLESAALRYL